MTQAEAPGEASTVEQVETSAEKLFQSERQHRIAELTLAEGRVDVAGLALRFRVTPETIRRDLSHLQTHRIVRRVHGGAIAWETTGFEPLLSVREDRYDTEKRRLAARAIEELPDDGTVLIDSGSTLTRFSEAIEPPQDLRFVSNSLVIAQELAKSEPVEVVVIGGTLQTNTLAMVDSDAIAMVERLTVDTLFISSDSASPEVGLTTPYREEAALKRAMIRSARRVVALIDYSKFGLDHFARFARWSDIDMLITNTELDPATVAQIRGLDTEVITT
ncbi:MAG: DeoR/GlpR family DNA-binding transcription regulator [Acidimicrobiales bacterium]